MRKYKGYYIDGAIFNSKEEIDSFLKKQAVDNFKLLTSLFAEMPNVANAIAADETSQHLINKYGFTWEQVEELENEVYASMS